MISKITLELRPEAILLNQVIDKAKEISENYDCDVEFEFNDKSYIINRNSLSYKVGDTVNFKYKEDMTIGGADDILSLTKARSST